MAPADAINRRQNHPSPLQARMRKRDEGVPCLLARSEIKKADLPSAEMDRHLPVKRCVGQQRREVALCAQWAERIEHRPSGQGAARRRMVVHRPVGGRVQPLLTAARRWRPLVVRRERHSSWPAERSRRFDMLTGCPNLSVGVPATAMATASLVYPAMTSVEKTPGPTLKSAPT